MKYGLDSIHSLRHHRHSLSPLWIDIPFEIKISRLENLSTFRGPVPCWPDLWRCLLRSTCSLDILQVKLVGERYLPIV